MAKKKNENPLKVVFHYPDGTVSDKLDPEFAKKLSKRIGEVASEVLSDESYIRLAEAYERDLEAKGNAV